MGSSGGRERVRARFRREGQRAEAHLPRPAAADADHPAQASSSTTRRWPTSRSIRRAPFRWSRPRAIHQARARRRLPANLLARPSFELVGVVIHSGTSNFGHYFSYAKERDGGGQAAAAAARARRRHGRRGRRRRGRRRHGRRRPGGGGGQWKVFNDTYVGPFDEKTSRARYGGTHPQATAAASAPKRFKTASALYRRALASRPAAEAGRVRPPALRLGSPRGCATRLTSSRRRRRRRSERPPSQRAEAGEAGRRKEGGVACAQPSSADASPQVSPPSTPHSAGGSCHSPSPQLSPDVLPTAGGSAGGYAGGARAARLADAPGGCGRRRAIARRHRGRSSSSNRGRRR